MLRARTIATVSLVGLLAVSACDSDDGRELPAPAPDQTLSIEVTTTTIAPAAEGALGSIADEALAAGVASEFAMTTDWSDATAIPLDNTCSGANVAPSVSWTGVPAGTVELALVMTDLDAGGLIHWVAFGIDPALGGLTPGGAPLAVAEATNDLGSTGYDGPCPPSGTHHYLLQLYALDQQLEQTDGAPAADVLATIGGGSLAVAGVTGLVSA